MPDNDQVDLIFPGLLDDFSDRLAFGDCINDFQAFQQGFGRGFFDL